MIDGVQYEFAGSIREAAMKSMSRQQAHSAVSTPASA